MHRCSKSWWMEGDVFIGVEMIWLYAMLSICLRSWSSKSLSLDAALLVGLGRSLRKVFQRALGISLDGLASLGPVGRADLPILVLDRKG